MSFTDFKGAAKPVDHVDIAVMAHRLAVNEDKMQAVKEVEAARSGFDSQRRPKMLFEPHVFYRNLSGDERDEAVEAGLAYRDWRRNYPSDSYPRLKEAIEINQTAALKSASWGAGQILGENHLAAGYETVEAMVEAFMEDEENHYEAMVNFILTNRLDDELRRGDWRGFARGYNGPRYAENGYHTKLAAAYARWQGVADANAPVLPDPASVGMPNGEGMKQVQRRLRELGYTEVGTPDGKYGYKTRAGTLAFRADHGMPLVAEIDDAFLVALTKASPRPVSAERATTDVVELRQEGSRTVKAADDTQAAGWLTAIVGGATALTKFFGFEDVADPAGAISAFQQAQKVLETMGPALMVGLAVFVIWKSGVLKKLRVEDHRTGKNAGPVS